MHNSHGSQPRPSTARPINGDHPPRTSSPSVLIEGYSPRPLPTFRAVILPPHHPTSRSSSPSLHTPHPLKHPTLTSRGPLPSPTSSSQPPTLISLPLSSGPTPSLPPPTLPASPPPFKRRRFLLLLAALTLASLSLFYLLPILPTLCSPSSSPSPLLKSPPSLTPHHLSTLALTPPPFLFPRPTPTLYLTAHPDPSSSLSAQFAQWLYGPYLALTLNASYAFTPLLKLSSRWTTFLGFGHGEVTEADLLGLFARSRMFVRNVERGGGEGEGAGGGGSGGEVVEWVKEKRRKVEGINKQLTDWARRVQTNPSLPYPKVDEPKGAVLDGYATTHLDPSNPITTATIFRLYRLPVPSLMHACHPPLLLLLRQKYCAARVRSPPPLDLYGEDRRAGHVIVALHIVCGDACYNSEKTSPLASYAATITRFTSVAAAHHLPPPSFHVFTTAPSNDSSPTFFSSLTSLPLVRLHVGLHSHAVFHHLVVSDVLVAAPLGAASTSWLVQLMHHGVVVGPAVPQHACTGEVGMYNRETGSFDEDSFVKVWAEVGGHKIRYESIADCAAIK